MTSLPFLSFFSSLFLFSLFYITMKQTRTFFLGDGDDKSICGCLNSQTMSKENAPSISVVAPYGKSVHVSFWENREKKAFDFHSLSLFVSLSFSFSHLSCRAEFFSSFYKNLFI